MRALAVIAVMAVACDAAQAPASDATLVPSETSSVLDGYDFDQRARRFDLPGRLDEVSGLAFTPDGRLFAHDDERGRVHEIDPITGEVGKRFDLGDDVIRDDFEGMAIVGERFFLVSSTGLLYEFREGDDRAAVLFRVTDTRLGSHCEIEGLDHDPVDDALVFACKRSTPDRGTIVLHRLPLDPDRPALPALHVLKAGLSVHGLGDDFDPSAVAVDPTGVLLVLSARHDALIEVDRAGTIVAGVPLSGGRHPQAEGLALGADGTIYIADERNGKDPRLTAYALIEPDARR